MALIRAKKFDSYDPPEDDFPRCLRARRGNQWYNFGHWGHLGFYAGDPGTMKSTTIECLAAAGLSGKEVFQQTFALDDRLILWADGQQPDDLWKLAQRRILNRAEREHDDRFIGMNYMSIINPTERLNDLYHLINRHRRDIGLIVMDTATDFLANPLDRQESIELINNFGKLGERLGLITLFVNHLTENKDKSAPAKMYGHFGTQLKNLASWGFINVQQGQYFGLTKGKFRYAPIPNMWFTRKDADLIPTPYFPY